jgi:acetoin utilization protein AcuC
MSAVAAPELSLVQINDPRAPRFAIDRDEEGQDTLLGTASRNQVEEQRALAAGLAPGQVRRGLRMLGAVLESMDDFCRLLGCEFYLVEPLFYHSAILYERRSCGYFLGRERMEEIHAGFLPGGELHRRLDDSSPFRRRGLDHTARGRSWAIHDGILGEAWQGVKMFRAPETSAGISTFPGGAY